MPFSLKRPTAANPKIKEWQSHDYNGDGYVEIVKYKTKARADEAAAAWGGTVTVVEVPWGAGEDPETYPTH